MNSRLDYGEVWVHGSHVKWTIPHQGDLPYGNEFHVDSKTFKVWNSRWYLRLYTNRPDKNTGWLAVGLQNQEAYPMNVFPYCVKMSMILAKEVLEFFPERDRDFIWYEARNVIERTEFDKRRIQLSPIDALVIYCDIMRDREVQTETESYVDKKLQDYRTLLFSKRDSDVTVKVQDKEYRVHKDILGSQSPVLFSLLKLDKPDKGPDLLTLEDIDPDIVPEFLHYLYIRSIGKVSSDKVIRMCTVAEKYQVAVLKTECLEYFKINISVKEFCDVIWIALKLHNKELVDIATEFFLENAEKIVVTDKWKEFLRENPGAANDLIIKLSKRDKCKK